MTLKERYDSILQYFKQANPNPTTELNFTNAFETLVAVILSAQCTDKRVNMVTPALFESMPDAETMATIHLERFLSKQQGAPLASYGSNASR